MPALNQGECSPKSVKPRVSKSERDTPSREAQPPASPHHTTPPRHVNQPPPFAPFRTDELYTLAEVARRINWGKFALATARRNGLPVRRLGRRHFVCGDELIAWVKEKGKLV